MATHERLKALEKELAAQGADGVRLELVRRARLFKRSWVDMAEALLQVRRKALWEEWGYDDFFSYCSLELLLTKSTVEKLTGSYAAVQQHAPKVLARDGVAQPIPAVDAVDYFAKVIRDSPANDQDDEMGELKQAVFDDNQPVAVLRRTFNPIFFPKSEEQEDVEVLEKTRAAARRLEGLLQRVEGLDEGRTDKLLKALAKLRDELADAIPKAKAAVEKAS
ncbi:MAG: hypothetical protein AAGE52_40700 [Myxococcota bacterium]